MSEREMRVGIRHFLYAGGAETLDVDELITIRDKCLQVMVDKKVPSAKTVHFLSDSKRLQVACNAFYYDRNINDDNSTSKLSFVTCDGCKRTTEFKKANGEDVEDKLPVKHLTAAIKIQSMWHSGETRHAKACDSYTYAYLTKHIAKNPADVTCKNCMRTADYAKRLAAYNKRIKKKKEVATDG